MHISITRTFRKNLQKKRKKNHSLTNRVAPIHTCHDLVDFPYGGRLCGTHVKEVYSQIATQQSLADELNSLSDVHSFEMEYNKHNELENVNILLTSLGQSPWKSQVTVSLDEQAPGAVRRLVAKFRQSVAASGNLIATTIGFCE